jgi:hypothetical protein
MRMSAQLLSELHLSRLQILIRTVFTCLTMRAFRTVAILVQVNGYRIDTLCKRASTNSSSHRLSARHYWPCGSGCEDAARNSVIEANRNDAIAFECRRAGRILIEVESRLQFDGTPVSSPFCCTPHHKNYYDGQHKRDCSFNTHRIFTVDWTRRHWKGRGWIVNPV